MKRCFHISNSLMLNEQTWVGSELAFDWQAELNMEYQGRP